MRRRLGIADVPQAGLAPVSTASPLERTLAAADRLRAQLSVARVAEVYANEIYAPNLREPWSIANRRSDLVNAVRSMQAARRPAKARAA